MFIYGITGPTGAGKSIAADAISKHGAIVLDCDEIYRELLLTNKEMQQMLVNRFGDIETDGEIDKKKLACIVFGDPAALDGLNKITHSFVIRETDRRIDIYDKQGVKAIVINAAALIESGYSKKCDIVMCITAPLEMRLSRITARDSISRDEALARIKAQKPDEFYSAGSNYTIDNSFENAESFIEACVTAYLIDKWFFEHTGDLIDDLGQLVTINSVRGNSKPGAPFGIAPREALQKGQNILEKHGFNVSVFEDMVITASYGPEPSQLGILTHLDIVEAGEHWETDPFTLVNKDGRLYGRGVMDNKGPAVASIYALRCVRELCPALSKGTRLILGSCEETGFEDIARYMEKNTMPPYVFSPDAGFPLINIEKGRFMPAFKAEWETDENLPRVISINGGKTANIVPNFATAVVEGISLDDAESYCKKYTEETAVLLTAEDIGSSRISVSAKGAAAHASRPHLGNNAQTALIRMLAGMPFAGSPGFDKIKTLARLFPHGEYFGAAFGISAEDKLSGKTTLNFGVLELSETGLTANFDARTAICADLTDLPGITREILGRNGMELTDYEHKYSHHTPAESPFVQALLRVYEQYTGKKGECLSTGGLTYTHDIPGGVAFGCTRSADDNNIHGPNEYIDIAELVLCAKIFTKSIIDICK